MSAKMSNKPMLGFDAALNLVVEHIEPLEKENILLAEALGRVLAEDFRSYVNSPSLDASKKDGYAVYSEDIARATPENPVVLKRTGLISAGMKSRKEIFAGSCIRVLTGARIPKGADAVVAEEFTHEDGNLITVTAPAESGRNILPTGNDVSKGEMILSKGMVLSPGNIGFLAASGCHRIAVYNSPQVGIVSTGDEVVAPGRPLPEGKLFASNLVTLDAWCRRLGLKTELDIVKDDPDLIREKLRQAVSNNDIVLTSGGAWTGDRDFVVKTLEQLGWKQMFHRIKLGPGKGVGFGTVGHKPVFVLPGGPPSNLMAFLQIALPGIMKLSGFSEPGLKKIYVRLSETVRGREKDWSQFIYGKIFKENRKSKVLPLKKMSRLKAMADADCIICIPDGVEEISAGEMIPVQLL